MKKDITEGKASKGGINENPPKTKRPTDPKGQGGKTLLKAFKYIVEISDSVLDRIHGFKYKISEIFVPDAELAFNEKGGLFITKSARCEENLEEIKITSKDVQIMKHFLIHKQECMEIIKKHYPQIEI